MNEEITETTFNADLTTLIKTYVLVVYHFVSVCVSFYREEYIVCSDVCLLYGKATGNIFK